MPKVNHYTNKYTKDLFPKRIIFLGRSVQNQVHTDPPQENPTFALSPLASLTYAIVTLGILFCGIRTLNFLLLYTACLMAIALLKPPVLKILLYLVTENFLLKGFKK